jgi:hypothetical protein
MGRASDTSGHADDDARLDETAVRGASVSWALDEARTARLNRRFDLVLLTGHAFQSS